MINANKLGHAAMFGDFDTFKRVADLCSDEDLANLYLKTCIRKENEEFVETEVPVLHYLSTMRSGVAKEKIKFLLERNYDVNKTDKNGYTALAYAVSVNDLEEVILLLENKANPFCKSPYPEYDTVYDSMFDKDGKCYNSVYKNPDINFSSQGNLYSGSIDEIKQQLQKIRTLCKPEFEGKPLLPTERVSYILLEGVEQSFSPSGHYDSQYLLKVSGYDEKVLDVAYINETKINKINAIKDKQLKKREKDELIRREVLVRENVLKSIIEKGCSVKDFYGLDEYFADGHTIFYVKKASHVSPKKWESVKKSYSNFVSYAENLQKMIDERNYLPKYPEDKLEKKAKVFEDNKRSVQEEAKFWGEKLSPNEEKRKTAEENISVYKEMLNKKFANKNCK